MDTSRAAGGGTPTATHETTDPATDALLGRLTHVASRLISFPSVADDPGALAACLDWACAHATGLAPALRLRRFRSHGVLSALLWHGDDPPRVLLAGHLDVVVPSGPDDFTARRDRQGRLYGRGAADMKGPIAALLDVLTREALPGLGLLLTTDEESGGVHGTGHVLARMERLPEVVVLPDGGANLRLIREQKGVLRLRLEAHGKAAHGSRPWLGVNAIERLYAGYEELRRHYPVPTDEEDWRVSISLTDLHTSGNSPNTIPQRALGMLDVRFPAGTDNGQDGHELAKVLARLLQPFHITTTRLLCSPAFCLDERSRWAAALQDAAQAELGHPLPLAREAGASDARFFAGRGMPALVFQPVCANWHSHDEWVDLASLARFRAICAAFARRALA